MGGLEHGDFFRAQVTVAYWYMGRALESHGQLRHRYLDYAHETYESSMRLLAELILSDEDRREFSRLLRPIFLSLETFAFLTKER